MTRNLIEYPITRDEIIACLKEEAENAWAPEQPTPNMRALLLTEAALLIARDGSTNAVREFAKAILHGSEEHRAWLLAAAEAYIAGRPFPEARQ